MQGPGTFLSDPEFDPELALNFNKNFEKKSTV
jgi:hypothetical protein